MRRGAAVCGPCCGGGTPDFNVQPCSRHSGKLAAPQDAARAPSLAKRATKNVATLTEVCNNEEVPEVEIVSLLQEHIPKYRLRADSLTQFGGYENQDWFIPSPALQAGPEDLALSPDQIRETLNYFLLCSNRVSQMTKTYNDIEAVTRLLEEKEKDLELTARIGKELLTANGRLEARVCALEGELRAARDHLTQLRHELTTKSDLLQVLTNDTEESECLDESGDAVASAEALARRTGALERENRALRDEAARLAAGTDAAEDAERALLRDIAHQLASANAEANSMGTELAGERERAAELQQQLYSSTARLAAAERSLAQLTADHEHTLQILEITRENQNALASELADAKERYAEVMAHLAEAQEQLRALRRRGEAAARGGGLMPSVAVAAGLNTSLHHELHSSIYSDLSLDSGVAGLDPLHTWNVKKVFETVQCATRWSEGSLSSGASEAADGVGGGGGGPPRPRKPMSLHSNDSLIDDSSDAESEDMYPGGTGGSGVPGAPGAAELAAALRRLTPAEISSRRAALHTAPAARYSYADSEGSAVWGAGGAAGRWRLPNKLQIVKPIEGSHTLHTWAQLAKPTMSGLLEEHEGVGVRGGRSAAALGLELYRLSDVEEDDDTPRLPYSSHVYTLTDSMVMHPNDGSVAGSVTSSAMSSASTSVLGSAWSSRRSSAASSRRSSAACSPTRTPRALSRRDSFAAPPPARARWSPTATPANSPLLNSPESSPPPSPRPGAAPSLHALISSGASILRRDPAAHSPLALQTPMQTGSLYTGLVHRSPMEQLTCLKRTLASPAARERREETPALGVPAAPGCGALDAAGGAGGGGGGGRARVGRGARAPRPRTDLGTVGAACPSAPAPAAPAPAPHHHSSPLGTLSSLLFGRKGGLL